MNTAATLSRTQEAETCSPSVRQPMPSDQARELARKLKALGDPTRLQLVSLIAAQQTGEACVCDLTGPVGLGQPTVSHHLKTLVGAGILSREKRGVWGYYSLVPGVLEGVASVLTTG